MYILLAHERKDVTLSITCGSSLEEYTIPARPACDRDAPYGVMSVGMWGGGEGGYADSMVSELHDCGACNVLDIANAVYMMHCSKITGDVQESTALRIAAGISWTTAFLSAKRPEKHGEANIHRWAELTATNAGGEIFGTMNITPTYAVFPQRSESCAVVR